MRIFWLVPLVLMIAGCGQQEISQRTYRELATQAPPSAGGSRPVALPGDSSDMSGTVPSGTVEVTWQAPAGWQEQAGTGVRLVTFAIDGAECTITAFPGDVGGLRANLGRWLGQLNVEAPSPEAMEEFVSGSEPVNGLLPGEIFDFSRWVGDDPTAPSMLAAVFKKSGSTVFEKMEGPRSVLADQRDAFNDLCRSVQ